MGTVTNMRKQLDPKRPNQRGLSGVQLLIFHLQALSAPFPIGPVPDNFETNGWHNISPLTDPLDRDSRANGASFKKSWWSIVKAHFTTCLHGLIVSWFLKQCDARACRT